MKVIQRIMPNLKLPLSPNQCSPKERTKAAAEMCKKFRKLIEIIPQEELTTSKYKEMVYSLLPQLNFPLEVSQVEGDRILGAFHVAKSYYKHNNNLIILHDAYNVKFDLEGDKITSDKETVVHETRHLLDHVCNPKFTRSITNKNLDTDAYFDILGMMSDINYVPKDVFQDKLKKIDKTALVEVLQSMRHSLQSEINAYTEMLKYAVQIRKNPIDKIIFLYTKYLNSVPMSNISHNLKLITRELKYILGTRHWS